MHFSTSGLRRFVAARIIQSRFRQDRRGSCTRGAGEISVDLVKVILEIGLCRPLYLRYPVLSFSTWRVAIATA